MHRIYMYQCYTNLFARYKFISTIFPEFFLIHLCKLSPKLGHKSASLLQFQDSRDGQKNTNNPRNNDDDEGCKSYQKCQGTRKFDCPAVIQLRGIKVFINPLYEVRQVPHQTSNSQRWRRKESFNG